MIRYPGSKAKIVREILSCFPHTVLEPLFQGPRLEYREPFFGGGVIGFAVMESLPARASVWINDKDFGMAALWKVVHQRHDELIDMVVKFQPTTDAFYRFQDEDNRTDMDPIRTAFQKFALHQTSFSGLGAMAGGPIGGRKQSSKYNVDCRWNADRHCTDIIKHHRTLKRFGARVRITSGDFAPLVEDAMPHAFVYADPPYYEKGGQLYKCNMSDGDHRRLAAAFQTCRAPWVLSYDDHSFIRDLYQWAEVEDIQLTYTIASSGKKRRKNSEVVIVPRGEVLASPAEVA
ncbi:MAG: DNA adenine methylase [Chloroflexi bacterium]|nr:DNA adenine methylase [Chloroflexota bacterium]